MTFGFARCSALAIGLCLAAAAAQGATTVRAVHGNVQVQRADRLTPVTVGMMLKEGDELQSDASGEALVRFHDGARLAVRPDASVQFRQLKLTGELGARQKTIKIVRGSLRYISGKATVRRKVTFETSTATIGIRGTDIEIVVSEQPVQNDPAGTYLKVNTGAAVITASSGEQADVSAGQLAFGGEPELVARGSGIPRRAAARKLADTALSVFKAGRLDALMR